MEVVEDTDRDEIGKLGYCGTAITNFQKCSFSLDGLKNCSNCFFDAFINFNVDHTECPPCISTCSLIQSF